MTTLNVGEFKQEPTLNFLKQLVIDAGFEVLHGACWEDGRQIYACSLQSDRRCYNHPLFEAQYSKDTRWLTVTGSKAVRYV